MTTCPVCGKGERGYSKMAQQSTYTISHLACVESYEAAMNNLARKLTAAELEAAFWKWLWHTVTGEKPGDDEHWLAHMRERWEKEGT
jgi:hypothetical protein